MEFTYLESGNLLQRKKNIWIKIGDLPSARFEVAAISFKGLSCFN
jgi:hypothetical protein